MLQWAHTSRSVCACCPPFLPPTRFWRPRLSLWGKTVKNESNDADWNLLLEAYDFGQFGDDFNQPQAKPVRAALRRILAVVQGTPASLHQARLSAALANIDKNGPLPGMISAFERHYGCKWTDPEWRIEALAWASAWKTALARQP